MFFLRISCTSSSSRSHACITLAFPKLLHCTVHYTEIHVNYNRTIQRGITLLHHKAVFTNPCYYATLATMPLSLGPKGWHSIEVWLHWLPAVLIMVNHLQHFFWKSPLNIIHTIMSPFWSLVVSFWNWLFQVTTFTAPESGYENA